MTRPDGRIEDDAGLPVLRFERRYDATPQELWAALTDGDRMARWCFRATFEPWVGGAMRFDYGEQGESAGTVLAWDEPWLLEYEWSDDPGDPQRADGGAKQSPVWRVRFRLRPDRDGTVLEFSHLAPAPRNPEYGAGWHWHLDRLAMLVGGTEPAAVPSDEHFEQLLRDYRARTAIEGTAEAGQP